MNPPVYGAQVPKGGGVGGQRRLSQKPKFVGFFFWSIPFAIFFNPSLSTYNQSEHILQSCIYFHPVPLVRIVYRMAVDRWVGG